ncbi:MAG: ATP-binding protein [Negativicutes bacterium]|nr:ATP-binding protein [Negativicutes bacterium]
MFGKMVQTNVVDEHVTQQQLKMRRTFLTHSQLIFLLGIFLIAGLWLFVWQQIEYDYDRTINETSREAMNLAIAFEENVRRILSEADKDLRYMKHSYEQGGTSNPAFIASALNAADDSSRRQVAVYDEEGIVTASYILKAVGEKRSDRTYFQVHRDRDSQELYIDRPIISRIDGSKVIPLTRRINNPDGSFGGIVYIGLKLDYLLEFYQEMNLGKDQMITLIGLDGIVRVRQSGTDFEVVQNLTNSTLWQMIQSNSSGTYIAKATVDGIERVISYRTMPDYPLAFAIGKATTAALADFEKRKYDFLFGALLLSLFIMFICCLLADRFEKQREHSADLENKVDDRTRDMQAAQKALHQLNAELEDIVNQRTQELQDSTKTLREEILERAKVEEHVRSQARMLDMARDYIVAIDMNCRILYWNRGAELGYGWLADEAVGQVTHSLLKTQFPVSAEAILNSLLTEGRWEGELTYTRKDGRQILVKSHQTLNRDVQGNPVSILEINHDITEHKKYEAEIARLDRLNIIGEMAAGIGHEVRNPMTTVRGYLQRFALNSAFAEYSDPITLMIEELDRANSIISEFLAVAKNKAVEQKIYNLNKVISALLPLLQAEAFHTGHQLLVEMDEVLDFFMDEKEIRQLILNLTRNGFEAMQRGGKLTIATFVESGKVVLRVSDNGKGIPQEAMDKLGTPFFTTKENGTGLGLAVCFRIAERHGARIDTKTSPQGTTFDVYFKIA